MNSWSILFSYSKFLRTTRISSMDIETSSLDENMISKQKDLENKNNENRPNGESIQIVMGMKTNLTQDLPKDRTKACLFLNPDYETNKTKNKNNTCARKEFNKILLKKNMKRTK